MCESFCGTVIVILESIIEFQTFNSIFKSLLSFGKQTCLICFYFSMKLSHSRSKFLFILLEKGNFLMIYTSTRKQNLEQFMVGDCNVLACTDLVSRGIDTQMVHHVVNYDFPASIVDYLHRVGRVGRVGQNINGSKVTNLVCGKISVALVQEIEKSVRLNRAIPDVESNVKSLYEKYAQIPTLVKPKDKRVKVSIDESSEID